MAVRLWAIMMVLVLLTVGFMWIFQVVLMARNYIESKINEVQAQLDPIMGDLETEDLAYNEQMLSDLSSTADGKMLIINDSGQLAEMYTFGHSSDLSANHSDVQVWERIANGENYPKILAGKPYTSERMDRSRVEAYEIGIPIRYHGEDAYLILYHSFEELYNVLDMNRRQLVILSVILTAAAAVLAAFLARRFTRPIRVIKRTVDRLAAGELTAVPGLDRRDEIGQLSHSVEELGQALQRVDVLRKEAIANVSHELRSPLALIGGYAEMVRDITWKDDQQRNENLDLIIRETNRMSETVRDIMDYSQFQSSYLQLNKGDYGLREIVWEEAGRWEKIARENHLTLQVEQPDTECPVHADALKLSQVLRNLFNNAVNHTGDGATITVRTQREADGCRVSVINPGTPIPEEERELIWERYQRSQHQAGRGQGTGIGLSIVKSILDAHGMSYGVDCRDGLTAFWFFAPTKQSRAAEADGLNAWKTGEP